MARRASKPGAASARKKRAALPFWLPAMVIAALVLWIYWPALHGDWIGDDSLYITRNPLLLDPERVWKAWFAPGSFIEYYPLEQTAQWVQWQLWGTDTWGYHVTNVALHFASALLVWRLLHKLGLLLAWLGGLLFAIHPMQVESVAYVNEFKSTLSLPLLLLAMSAWVDFEKRRDKNDYLWALGWFVAAMLAKASAAPFPVVMLLYAWYLRGRISIADVKAAAPFFAVALGLGALTLWSGQAYAHASHTMPAAIPLGGIFSRIALAGTSLAFYFARCLVPISPSPMYPQWSVSPPAWWMFLPWVAFGTAVAALWARRTTWGRPVLLGLGFFVAFLAPFLGFNEASYMATVWVMDHFLYVPIIGLIGLVVAGLELLTARITSTNARMTARGIVVVALAALALESHLYAVQFADEITLMRYTIARNPQTWLAHDVLGVDLLNKDKTLDAVRELEAAAALHPDYAKIHASLGAAYAKLDRTADSQAQFAQALQIDPDDAQIYTEMAREEFQAGETAVALQHLQKSIQLDPNDPGAHMLLGISLCQSGAISAGLSEFDTAAKLNPTDANIPINHGIALAQAGRMTDAAAQFEIALRLDPNNATAREYLARVQSQQPASR